MANEILMKAEGIKGAVSDGGHKEEIELLSFNANLTPQTGHVGGGGTGRVMSSDVTFSKEVDSTSSDLFLRMANGIKIPKVTVTLRKQIGREMQDKLKYEFTDVMLTSYATSRDSVDAMPLESVAFSYLAIFITVMSAVTGRHQVEKSSQIVLIAWLKRPGVF